MTSITSQLTIGKIKTVGDMSFHEIEGGFGKDKRSMLVKEIASIHNQPLGEINRRINENRKRFIDNRDIIDLKGSDFVMALTHSEIYTQNALNASTNIYILSERGYAKLLKILEDDLAWEKYDQLVDGYFQMRGIIKNAGKLESLSAVNTALKIIMPTLEEAGMKLENRIFNMKQLYRRAGVELTVSDFKAEGKTFTKEAIAETFGILSEKGNLYAKAVGGIIQQIELSSDEVILISYEKNDHIGQAEQYAESVVAKIRAWLETNNYPTQISYTDKNGSLSMCRVKYLNSKSA